MQGPLVSIRCMVFNHEPFLRQCLDGFMMQKTSFAFEAIVHDDASTDESAAIIREYAEKYPDIIKPIYETENQYSKHDGALGRIMEAAMHPDSKYIAFCEGDDYWTDPFKLQKQVDFLESHLDYVLCCGNHLCYQQSHDYMEVVPVYDWAFEGKWENAQYIDVTLDNFFDRWWIRGLTSMYRRRNYIEEMKAKGYSVFRDDVFYYTVLRYGKGALLRDVLGVYRRHSGGVWAGNNQIDNCRVAISDAFQIYDIEGDKRAFTKIRQFTIRLLKLLNTERKTYEIVRELRSYYQKVPIEEFMRLLYNLESQYVRNGLSKIYHHLIRK